MAGLTKGDLIINSQVNFQSGSNRLSKEQMLKNIENYNPNPEKNNTTIK